MKDLSFMLSPMDLVNCEVPMFTKAIAGWRYSARWAEEIGRERNREGTMLGFGMVLMTARALDAPFNGAV
jgi:hypothetical protein